MVTCDYCSEPITDTGAVCLSAPTAIGSMVRIDLHSECVTPYAQKSASITGKRPRNGGTR